MIAIRRREAELAIYGERRGEPRSAPADSTNAAVGRH
jgi:hypothetical protein